MSDSALEWASSFSDKELEDIAIALENIEPDDLFPAKIACLIELLKKGELSVSFDEFHPDLIIHSFRHNHYFQILGTGSYSTCFKAIKTQDTYKVNWVSELEDPWLAYAEVSKSFPENSLLPKTYDIFYYGSTYCAIVEELQPISSEHKEIIEDDSFDITECISNNNTDQLFEIIKKYSPLISKEECSNLLYTIDESISVFQMTSGNCISCIVDLYDSNFMMRGQQLVINDPLA